MNRTQESEFIRSFVQEEIEKLKQVKDKVIREKAMETVVTNATFRLAHIWIGDIKTD